MTLHRSSLKRLILASAMLGWPAASLAAAPACNAPKAALIAAIAAVHAKQHNVGVQTAILFDGRIVFSQGLGLADRERHIPVTRTTRFPLASLTKAYTGVAVLKAAATGKLLLDEPIQKYVPEFPVKPELTITPRRLAAHRTGIHHWGKEREALYARHFDRLVDIVRLFKDDPLLPKAGLEYQYSSYGYNLLGLALERATGVEFTRYVRQTVLQPLKLTNTRFDDARKSLAGEAKLYSFFDLKTYAEIPNTEPLNIPLRDYSHNMAGGNMSSTAEDAVKFGAALLKPGFLTPEEYKMLFTQPSFEGGPSSMSFGFFVSDPGSEPRLSMSGANQGVQSGLMVYPSRKLAVAVMSNTWGRDSRSAEMVVALPERLADLCRPAI